MILGGGFAGLGVVQFLTKANHSDLEIVLVDKKDFFIAPQNLYSLATSFKGSKSLAPAWYGKIFNNPNTVFVKKKITRIDPKENRVFFDDGSEYVAEYLVIALGSQNNSLNGSEFLFSIKSAGEALRLNRHLNEIFAKYKAASLEKQRQEFSVGIIGGGATGVEIAGKLISVIKKLAVTNHVNPRIPTISIYESKSEILNHLPGYVRKAADEELKNNKIIINNNCEIISVRKGMLENKGGAFFNCATPIFAGGVRAHDILMKSDMAVNPKGGLIVENDLSLKNYPKIFAVGDCTYAYDPESHKLAPDVISAALDQAEIVAENIVRRIQRRTPISYIVKRRDVFLSIGKRQISYMNGKKYQGFLASLYRKYYILKNLAKILPSGTAIGIWRKII